MAFVAATARLRTRSRPTGLRGTAAWLSRMLRPRLWHIPQRPKRCTASGCRHAPPGRLDVDNSSSSSKCCKGISGLVAEYIVAIDVTRARFPADACSQLPAGAAASPRHDVAAFAAPSLSPWHLWQRLHDSGQGHGRLVCVGLLPGLVDAASTSVAYSSAAEAVHCKRLSPCAAGGG